MPFRKVMFSIHLASIWMSSCVVAVLATLTAPLESQASEIFQRCGPKSTGFARLGKDTICIGGDPNWRRMQSARPPAKSAPSASAAEASVSGGENKDVDDALNNADIQFREGETKLACRWVSNAISAATSSYQPKPTSANQKAQLKTYAQRCNLRY